MKDVAVAILIVGLVGVVAYVLTRPTPIPVNVVYTEDIYPRYRNWDLWPIPMFPNSQPFGGHKHKYPPPPPPPLKDMSPLPPPGTLPVPPAPSTPVPPPVETFASV